LLLFYLGIVLSVKQRNEERRLRERSAAKVVFVSRGIGHV
jgi:hypothetical protein